MDGQSVTAAFIFMDYQVYLECHSMHCCEAIGKPLAVLHSNDMERFQRGVSSRHGSSHRPGSAHHVSLGRTGRRSRRSLTYSSDTLIGVWVYIWPKFADEVTQGQYNANSPPFHLQNISQFASSMQTIPTTLTHKLTPPQPHIPFLPRILLDPELPQKSPCNTHITHPIRSLQRRQIPQRSFPTSYLARLTASREGGLQDRFCGASFVGEIHGRKAVDGAFF
jgi:hypothetical protein